MQLRVNAGGATTKFVIACVAVCAVGVVVSAACTVKAYALPATVGVPVIAPVAVLKLRPPGNAPALIEYVYGVVPPAAAQLAPVYATPTCAVAGKVHVNVRAAAETVKLVIAWVALCAVGVVLSTTFTVNE